MRTVQTPAKMVISQYVQRHETPATDMKPLLIGPRAGPAKGPRVKKANAFPRVLGSHISPIKALDFLLGRVNELTTNCDVPADDQRRCSEASTEETEDDYGCRVL